MSDFCNILKGFADQLTDHAKANERAPEPVHRAYVDLVTHAFLYFRISSRRTSSNKDEFHDIADALHNISGILFDYGSWINDTEYRRLYLRRFDEQWASNGFGMEAYLDARIAYHTHNLDQGRMVNSDNETCH